MMIMVIEWYDFVCFAIVGISTFTCSAARNVTKHLIMATGTKEQSAFGVTSCCKFHARFVLKQLTFCLVMRRRAFRVLGKVVII